MSSKYWNSTTKGLALLALVFLVYGFGIGRPFIFDDVVYISANPILRRGDALHAFWFTSEALNYYPLFWSLLRLQWLLWGDHPLGYHLVNLVLHGANAFLIWRVALKWELPGAWWIAALFAVHPVNVQTVAWAAEQKNTWSFLFMALALLAFLPRGPERRSSHFLSLGFFGAALACKTSTVCLPVFLTIYCAFERRKSLRSLLPRILPFYALGVAAGLTTIWFEHQRLAAHSLVGTLTFWQRLETAGATFWFYLGKALLPVHLTPMYNGWVDSTAALHTVVPGLLLVALLATCAIFWRRIGAAVALGIIYYALMLLPLLGMVDTNYFAYSLIADHWQYHALPGLIVAVVAAASALAQRLPRPLLVSNIAGASVLLGCTILSSIHFAHFEDARSLWSYVVKENPRAWIGWYNLGNVYADDHSYADAISFYDRSLLIKPDYAQSHFNLANALAATHRLEEADREYLAAEKIKEDDPDSHNNRGVALLRLGRDDEAIAEFRHAIQLEPAKALAHVNLMTILLKRGRIDEAAVHLERAGTLTDTNAHRLADAITACAQHAVVDKAALARFARRACELNANQPDLRAALTKLITP